MEPENGATADPFRQKRFQINKKLLPIKFHYFIYFAALACVLPFRTIYAKQLGVSGTEMGITFAIIPLIKVFTNPICGAIVDRYKRFRVTLYAILLLVALSHLSLTFIPIRSTADNATIPINATNGIYFDNDFIYEEIIFHRNSIDLNLRPERTKCDIHCDQLIKFELRNISYLNCTWLSENQQDRCGVISTKLVPVTDQNISLQYCDDIMALSIRTSQVRENPLPEVSSCLDNATHKCILELCSIADTYSTNEPTIGDTTQTSFQSLQFWLFLLLMIISNSAFSAAIFLVDVVCYEILDNQPEKYGQQRLWGAIGWGTGSLLAGYFNELFTGDSKTVDYTPCFYLLAALTIIDFIPLHFVRVENVKYSQNITKDVARLIQQPDFIVYAVIVFCIGGLSGLIWNYEFWFLEDLEASQTLLGLTQTVQCFLSEVPCLFLAGWVCKKIGYGHCNTIALFFFFLRYIVFVPMKDPWLALPAGLLHGPTFGLFFAAMTALAKEKALPGTEATVQAVFAVIFEAMGVAAGSILGGIGIDRVGSRMTFLYAAIFSFCMLFINVIALQLLRIKCAKGKIEKFKNTSKNVNQKDAYVKQNA